MDPSALNECARPKYSARTPLVIGELGGTAEKRISSWSPSLEAGHVSPPRLTASVTARAKAGRASVHSWDLSVLSRAISMSSTQVIAPEGLTANIERFLEQNAALATPFLVFDLDVVEARYLALLAALPVSGVLYAVKANPAPEVLVASPMATPSRKRPMSPMRSDRACELTRSTPTRNSTR
jgi:hypothetical protein